MKVLVLGGEGMPGHKFFEVLSRRFDTSATFLVSDGPWREFPQFAGVSEARLLGGVDALRFETVAAALEQARPEAVVNCVGIIKQLKEASDPMLTITPNSLLPHRLAALCAGRGARLVHMSTDCVFSGRKGGAYTEGRIGDVRDYHRVAAREALEREYSSADDVMARETLDHLPIDHRLTLSATADGDAELRR